MSVRRKQAAAESPDAQLAAFLRKFTPEIEAQATAALQKMRALLPGAYELVYDNYNALAIGFSPSERASEAVFSIAVYPRWVSLFFLQDRRRLRDPEKLLKGSGSQARHIVLDGPETINLPAVRDLMAQAHELADVPLDSKTNGYLVIKSIAAKQRPRRPPIATKGASKRTAKAKRPSDRRKSPQR
jgi:hypothetical protein